MSFNAYEEYKDSGVEWLGDAPAHWKIVKVKSLFEIKKRIAGSTGHDILSITQKGIKIKDISGDEGQISSDYSKYQLVQPGDFAMNQMDLLTGYVDISKYQGVTSPDYRVFSLRRSEKTHGNYFLWVFRNAYHLRIFFPYGKGAAHLGRWRLPANEFNTFLIPQPLVKEQEEIAIFLDHETARIDALIEEQQRLIALLKEKRQAVISHAVTKGLDPNVPMKDSGVEWLGDVPAHWEVIRLKLLGKLWPGYAFKSSEFSDSGHPVIKITNVAHLEFNWSEKSFLAETSISNFREFSAPKNSIIFAMTRPIISGGIKVAMLESDMQPLINQRVGFMKPPNNNIGKYIVYSTQAYSFIAQFKNKLTITNQPNISGEGIESIYIALPPTSELKFIIKTLNKNNNIYRQLIESSAINIKLLQERRSGLISAAVTGKIDVRDWQPPKANQTAAEPAEASA